MTTKAITTTNYKFLRRIDATPEVIAVHLEPEGQPIPFEAGKYMVIAGIDKEGKKHKGWAFSIASAPYSPILELFVVKEHMRLDNGVKRLHRSHFLEASPGDIFAVTGPNGNFTLKPKHGNKVLLLAAGTGIAGEFSTIRQLAYDHSSIDIALIYSVKRENEIIYAAELRELAAALKAKMLITVTRPDESPGWSGKTGRINAEMIKEFAPDVKERACFVCGPDEFVASMKGERLAGDPALTKAAAGPEGKKHAGGALISLGVPKDMIETDPWG